MRHANKKVLLTKIFAACIAALALTACGGDDEGGDSNPDGPCEGFDCPPDDDNNGADNNGEAPEPAELPWALPPDTTASWEDLAGRPCPEDNALSWENFGGPLMLNWCTGCHSAALPDGQRAGAPVGVDLDTPEAARQWAARIWARSADGNATMPPWGGPDEEDRFLLGQWLACGAP
jgi:hypothetical protein